MPCLSSTVSHRSPKSECVGPGWQWLTHQREACAASATKLEMFPNVPSSPCPSIQSLSLYRTQTLSRQKTERDSPVFPVSANPLSRSRFTFRNKLCPSLSSQIYLVRTTKIAGPSLPNMPFALCCLTILIFLRVLNVLRGRSTHATPTFPSLKV